MKILNDLSHLTDRCEILALAEEIAEQGKEVPDIDFTQYAGQFPDIPYSLDHWCAYDVPYVLSVFFSLCRIAQIKEIARERIAERNRALPPVIY